jgi:nitroreductase
MDFFAAVQKRRSIRKFKPDKVPAEVIEKALAAAILAPTSSNSQTWNFYWAVNESTKKDLVHYCLNQSAARTASDLMVIVASPSAWKRSHPELVKWVHRVQAPKMVVSYYERVFPMMYRWGFLNSLGLLKKISYFIVGFFRPIMRGPATLSEIQVVCTKSAALAAENFVLALTAQGVATCMMEGFDECRVKKLFNLKYSDRVAMVIAIGFEDERGTWGPRYRLPLESVVHRV